MMRSTSNFMKWFVPVNSRVKKERFDAIGSTCIKSVSYNNVFGVLKIIFTTKRANGSHYSVKYNIASSGGINLYNDFKCATSKGKFFHEHIRKIRPLANMNELYMFM